MQNKINLSLEYFFSDFSLTGHHFCSYFTSGQISPPKNFEDNCSGLSQARCPFYGQLTVSKHTTTTTVLRPFFQDHPGKPVPEENFWTLWCKRRLTAADILTPSRLTSAHHHHPPYFFTGPMPFLLPKQPCKSTEGNFSIKAVNKISAEHQCFSVTHKM